MNLVHETARFYLDFGERSAPVFRPAPKASANVCTVHVTDGGGNVLSARVGLRGFGRDRANWHEVDHELPPALAVVKFRRAGTHVRYWRFTGRARLSP